jgi:hypothetical protein
MYGKPFLLNLPKLKLLIESSSVDAYLPNASRRAQSLLKYSSSEFLEFTRTRHQVANNELKEIVEFEKEYENGSLRGIKIVRTESEKHCGFRYKKNQIEEIGKIVFNKQRLDDDELNLTELVFIQVSLRWHDELNLLITNDNRLLKNRLWFEGHFPGGDLNIVTLEEAAEIVDLYFKSQGKYYLSTNYTANKGFWYWLSLRLKVPFFNVGDPIIDALAKRFHFALISVDEMGFQYYSGVNNDTMDFAIYHFNYLILLISGIFDSLAIRTHKQYKLAFNGSDNPCRISLQNDLGKLFLRALREKNSALRNHVNEYVNFIKVIYLLRDTILHREGLETPKFESRNADQPWQANLIEVPKETAEWLRLC